MKNCPCNKNVEYAKCCEPFHNNSANPNNAEQLMRSRYSAYVLGNIDYITRTQSGKAAQDFDPQSASQWAQRADWISLKVKRSWPHPTNPETAFVEFIAKYRLNGKLHKIYEISEFKQVNQQWFYVDGRQS